MSERTPSNHAGNKSAENSPTKRGAKTAARSSAKNDRKANAPVRVILGEIPEEGRDFDYDRESGELDGVLRDLIGERPYSVHLHIKPLGNAYELSGRIETSTPEICSKCGADIDVPVAKGVREFLVEEDDEFRNAHSVNGNGSVDFLSEENSSVAYQGGVFELGEYVHEAIALAEPFYPACPEGACQGLEEIARKKAELERSFKSAGAGAGHPGFAALRGLKLGLKID